MRGVIYNDTRGGYINNVPGTFARANTDIGIHYANYPNGCAATGTCQVPPDSARRKQQRFGRQCHQPGHLSRASTLRAV